MLSALLEGFVPTGLEGTSRILDLFYANDINAVIEKKDTCQKHEIVYILGYIVLSDNDIAYHTCMCVWMFAKKIFI